MTTMTTMTTDTVVRTWTDGYCTTVQQCGRSVTVQVLGDVYPATYADELEAAIMFDAEVLAQQMMTAQVAATISSLEDYDDDDSI